MGTAAHTTVKTKTRSRHAKRVTPLTRPRMARIVRPRLKLARVLRTLRAHMPDLTARYPIQSLGIFGSYVRGDATTSSDLDVLVELKANARIGYGFIGIQNDLSDLLGVQVDLIEKKTLKPRILQNVLKEVIYI